MNPIGLFMLILSGCAGNSLYEQAKDKLCHNTEQEWYPDNDSDGFGDGLAGKTDCQQPGDEYVLVATDCDDTEPDINPVALEERDGVDNDCDSQIDEGFFTDEWAVLQAEGLVLLESQNEGAVAGTAVTLGDVNGDEQVDVIVGAPGIAYGGVNGVGAVYTLFGPLNEGQQVDLQMQWAQLRGEEAGESLGSHVAVGDINGDGIGDLFVLADGRNQQGIDLLRGKYLYVVAGGPNLTKYEQAALWQDYAVTTLGTQSTEQFNNMVFVEGEFGDMAMGAVAIARETCLSMGNQFYSDIALYTGDGLTQEVTLVTELESEEANDLAGTGLSAGDVTGDGDPELVVGAPAAHCQEQGDDMLCAGGIYLVSDLETSTGNLADSPHIYGEEAEGFGELTAVVGDMDADGYHDFAATGEGRLWVFQGEPDVWDWSGTTSESAVADYGQPDGLDFSSLVSAGDVDADGFDDLLVGTSEAQEGNGRVDLFYGGSEIPMSFAADHNKASWLGSQTEALGWAAAGADTNYDGHRDLLFGAPQNSKEDAAAGMAYLVLVP